MIRALRSLAAVALTSLVAAWGCGGSGSPSSVARSEREVRAALGIPDGAERVMVVSQSSHLDLNFLNTYDGYYDSSIQGIFRTALDLLGDEPDYRYSIAEIAWLRRYWDDHPGERERIRAAAARGALRIVGGGLTSPDTVLPTGESLMRDWQMGIAWVRENLGVRPMTAWQPDSFGHSATLPSVLEQFGFRSVGFFRVDGGAFGQVTGGKPVPIAPGSTAETLADLDTADYVWRAPDGAEVLARWLPYGYGMGDDLDFSFPWYAIAGFGINWNTPAFTDESVTNERFATYVASLEPYRRTPYTFLPVGIDFSWPKPKLLDYVRRWNAARYPSTGVWIAAATFDEYTRLIEAHRRELPALDLDINPYFTGFYTTHAGLKTRLRDAHGTLTDAEKIGSIAGTARAAAYPFDALDSGWDGSAFMNHHDAITGTTTSTSLAVDLDSWTSRAVGEGEKALAQSMFELGQAVDTSSLGAPQTLVVVNPSSWERSEAIEVEVPSPDPPFPGPSVVDPVLGVLPTELREVRFDEHFGLTFARIAFPSPPVPSLGHRALGLRFDDAPGVPRADLGAAVTLTESDDEIVLANGRVTAVLRRDAGYCLTSLRSGDSGELLTGPSNDVVTYRDWGGAYRLASEVGRPWGEIATSCSASAPPQLVVLERGPVRAAVRLTGANELGPVVREIGLGAGSDRLELTTTLAAPDFTSVVARFRTRMTGATLTTSVPFGEIERPRHKLFDPTYWPVTEWVDLASPSGVGGLWLSAGGSRGMSASEDGVLDVMLTRNVFWDALGPPGDDRSSYATTLALGARGGGDWIAGASHRRGIEAQAPFRVIVGEAHAGPLPSSLASVLVDRPDVDVSTLKRAYDRSEDLVLRLIRHGSAGGSVRVRTAFAGYTDVWAVDGMEDPLDGVAVDGTAQDFTVDMDRTIRSLRLRRAGS